MTDMYNNQYGNSSKNVHLVSQEGESFDVPLPVASMSELVKQMIDEDQLDDEEAQEIPLPNVKSTILAKIIEYCQYYRQYPMNEIEKASFFCSAFFLFISDFPLAFEIS
jgi:hypothetical protein